MTTMVLSCLILVGCSDVETSQGTRTMINGDADFIDKLPSDAVVCPDIDAASEKLGAQVKLPADTLGEKEMVISYWRYGEIRSQPLEKRSGLVTIAVRDRFLLYAQRLNPGEVPNLPRDVKNFNESQKSVIEEGGNVPDVNEYMTTVAGFQAKVSPLGYNNFPEGREPLPPRITWVDGNVYYSMDGVKQSVDSVTLDDLKKVVESMYPD